ncbi:TonB-dependent receptor [Rhizorhabdus histidinilytica]|uniref:Iron complex outermembrane recepter protein n=1 Tax=Rhizorhabdus histidinilytica TaxID=439228 RepID=A0A1T5EMV6_9SPHN|nr:TonB-dependent receptor [Rhizorhabdus histidinilytica]SKB85205.1 iron complex outermembrane recepter protein [Rhizorhabdus histidinilytica]
MTRMHPHGWGLSASLSALALAMVAAPAQAQAPAAADAATGADDDRGLADIVVTAQRREQSLSRVPVSVQAVGAATLKTQVIEDTPSLVKASPSVAFTGGFSANSSGFLIRGISSASSEGGVQQSTAMVIDGVPLARPGEFLGDLGDIERVEILRGPQGTLFGKNATAGVVSIVTQRPTDDFRGYIEGGATTDEEYLIRGMINAPLGQGARLRLNGYYRHLDPLVKNLSTGADQYGFENYGFAAKLDLDLSDTVTAKLSADYRHGYSTFGQALNIVPSTGIGAQQIAALGFTPTPGVVKMATDGISFDRSRGYSFTGELGWEANDRVKVTSITGYRDFRDDNLSDVDNTPAGFLIGKGFSPNPTRYPVMYVSTDTPRQPQRVSYFSEELRANYSDERLDVVGGFFYQTLKDRGEGVTPFIFDGAFVLRNPALAGTYFYNATYLNYRIDDDTWAAFGDVTFKLNDTLSLFAGARYTHESIQLKYDNVSYFGAVAANYGAVILPGPNGQPAIDVATARPNLAPTGAINYQIGRVTNNVSGRAGIQWQPTTDYNFYFSYNRGYKGSAADVSRGSGNPTATYSPLLAPEIATSFELGSKGRLFDGNVQYSLNFFKQKVRNLQQAVVQLTGANATVTQLINAGAVKTDGVEFEARARVADGLTLDGGFAYADPRYSGGLFVACYPGQTVAQGCVNNRQAMNGKQTVNSYKWRYNLGATYTNDLPNLPVGVTINIGWQWFDDSPQRVDTDPLLVEPSRGMLDASITIADDDQRWSLQIYGKNLTNNFYYGGRVNVDNTISRVSGYVFRDYKRYGGMKLTYNF